MMTAPTTAMHGMTGMTAMTANKTAAGVVAGSNKTANATTRMDFPLAAPIPGGGVNAYGRPIPTIAPDGKRLLAASPAPKPTPKPSTNMKPTPMTAKPTGNKTETAQKMTAATAANHTMAANKTGTPSKQTRCQPLCHPGCYC